MCNGNSRNTQRLKNAFVPCWFLLSENKMQCWTLGLLSVWNVISIKHSNSTVPIHRCSNIKRFPLRVIPSSSSSSVSTYPTVHPPSLDSVKPIWERCRLGCLLERPTMVPSPPRHLLVPLQTAVALPTGQFRWSAVSCHPGHPPWLPLKDNGTVSVTSGSLPLATTLLHLWCYSRLGSQNPAAAHGRTFFWTIQNQVWWIEKSGWGTIVEGYKQEWVCVSV